MASWLLENTVAYATTFFLEVRLSFFAPWLCSYADEFASEVKQFELVQSILQASMPISLKDMSPKGRKRLNIYYLAHEPKQEKLRPC
jgi:hypothetical protein